MVLMGGLQGEGESAVHKWSLPSLSEILALSGAAQTTSADLPQPCSDGKEAKPSRSIAQQQVRAERQWTGAIAALNALLQRELAPHLPQASTEHLSAPAKQGLILSGPASIVCDSIVNAHLATWTFTPKALDAFAWMPFQLPPASEQPGGYSLDTTPALPLLPDDPLAAERFCLVLTATFSLVMVLGEQPSGEPAFSFSFDPDVIHHVWRSLRPRVLLMSGHQVGTLDTWFERFAPVTPHYKTVMEFSQLILHHLPEPLEWLAEAPIVANGASKVAKVTKPTAADVATPLLAAAALKVSTEVETIADPGEVASEAKPSADVELLKAIAHEVRTPLTTIRTLTRLLLRRKDLAPEVLKRLEVIDRECNEQIDRFGLIFRAVELETSTTKRSPVALAPMSLDEVMQQSIPRWQKQATQRNLTLNVVLPQKMPTVVSDPTMLDQALSSLIERFARSLPGGSHIEVQVTQAGSQLKLQFQSQLQAETPDCAADQNATRSTLKSLGQLLMFQPETGSLSLNLGVTKNIFQALGGKLIVRERPQQGEVMTIFLPLEVSHLA